ncbi:helix-turn-helix domain-containing protein [Aliikangiella sp. IMCC44359]|uniref:helix-turn-helix domain-containing protein n=1 Tax=Aliikangiella sp. IMCC44359 TaxID=3459125 RepID=UPI00403AC35A
MKATKFGLFIRQSRLIKGVNLKQMAESMDMKPSFLSALELGKKAISDETIEKIINYLELDEVQQKELKEAAERSQPIAKVNLTTESVRDRELVLMFARKFREISDEEKQRLEDLLL